MTQLEAFTEKERKALISDKTKFYAHKLGTLIHIRKDEKHIYCDGYPLNEAQLLQEMTPNTKREICPSCIRIKYAQFL